MVNYERIEWENMRKDHCQAHFQKKEKKDKTVHRNLQKGKEFRERKISDFLDTNLTLITSVLFISHYF